MPSLIRKPFAIFGGSFLARPQFKDRTTLAINYPQAALPRRICLGPASFIYSPEKQAAIPISVRLSAMVSTQDNVLRVITAHGEATDAERGYISTRILECDRDRAINAGRMYPRHGREQS